VVPARAVSMDFTVLNDIETRGKRKKRRNRKNKGRRGDASSSTSRDASSSTSTEKADLVDPVVEICLQAGFTIDEIDAARMEIFMKSLRYDSPNVVKTYMETKARLLREHASGTSAPRENGIREPLEEMAAAPSDSSSTAKVLQRGGEIEEQQGKEEEEENKEKNVEERVRMVLNNIHEIDPLMKGLRMWCEAATEEDRQVLLKEDILETLMQRVFDAILEPSELTLPVLTSIRRHMAELFAVLVSRDKDLLMESLQPLLDGITLLRTLGELPSEDRADMVKAACEILQHMARKLPSVTTGPLAVKSVEEIQCAAVGLAEVTKLEEILAQSVPRGDSVLGGHLGATDLSGLFKLRDSGKLVVDISAKCLSFFEVSGTQSHENETHLFRERMDILLHKLQEKKKCAAEEAKSKRDALEALLSDSGLAQSSVARLEDEKAASEKEIGELHEKKQQLEAELEQTLGKIAERKRALKNLEAQLKESEKNASDEVASAAEAARAAKAAAERRSLLLEACGKLNEFRSLVSSGRVGEGSRDTAKHHEDPVVDWKIRTAMALDRYLGVESACIDVLQGRIRDTEGRIKDFQNKHKNLTDLGMKTLADEALSREGQETLKKAEDEQAIEMLKKTAQDAVKVLPSLVQKDLPLYVASALHRCVDNIRKIELDVEIPELPKKEEGRDIFNGLQRLSCDDSETRVPSSPASAPPSTPRNIKVHQSPPVLAPRPKSTWAGWKVSQSQTPKTSLAAITAEEEKAKQSEQIRAKQENDERVASE